MRRFAGVAYDQRPASQLLISTVLPENKVQNNVVAANSPQ